jgi:glycine betaine/choline ABC-type transport system substrate-binding protein
MDRKKTYAAVIASAALLSACSRPREIVVGSKNFSEQLILGEITAQHLERKLNRHIVRKLDLGGTLLAHQAITTGQIDIYPEYTGTALTAILKQPPVADRAAVLQHVRLAYAAWNLEWAEPLGFNNTFAMVIRKEDADARNVHTLSEAAAYTPGWRLGVGYEFVQRPDGLTGLISTYRLNAKGSVKTMDLGLLYQALEQRRVDMVAGNETDGLLSAKPFVVLADDKHYFPPYEAALVLRTAACTEFPGLREAVAGLSGKIDTATMRKMNYELDGKHRPVKAIAREFLDSIK